MINLMDFVTFFAMFTGACLVSAFIAGLGSMLEDFTPLNFLPEFLKDWGLMCFAIFALTELAMLGIFVIYMVIMFIGGLF